MTDRWPLREMIEMCEVLGGGVIEIIDDVIRNPLDFALAFVVVMGFTIPVALVINMWVY